MVECQRWLDAVQVGMDVGWWGSGVMFGQDVLASGLSYVLLVHVAWCRGAFLHAGYAIGSGEEAPYGVDPYGIGGSKEGAL